MELDESQVNASLNYKGRNYYFCSIGCRAEFERHPEDYARVAPLEESVDTDV